MTRTPSPSLRWSGAFFASAALMLAGPCAPAWSQTIRRQMRESEPVQPFAVTDWGGALFAKSY